MFLREQSINFTGGFFDLRLAAVVAERIAALFQVESIVRLRMDAKERVLRGNAVPRGDAAGAAMIQTMTSEHPVLLLAAKQDYDAFYDMEIAIRELHHCPPFSDLFFITFTGLYEDRVQQAAARFRNSLRAQLKAAAYLDGGATVLGPAPCAIVKVNYTYRYRLTLAAKNSKNLRQLLSSQLKAFSKDKQNRGVNAYADVNSYD